MKKLGLISALLLISISLILVGLIYFDWLTVGFMVGPYRFHHWSVMLGAFYIAVATPFFSVLKRIKPESLKNLYRIHVFGNLLAVLLISIHFGGQLSRPAEFYPDLGSGVALYVSMLVLSLTGFFLRFRLTADGNRRLVRWVHVLAVVFFYLIITLHTLHGFGLI
jgi:hypothetical protein